MNNFEYVRADGLEGAAQLVAGNAEAKFIGGGTNLVDLMKYNVERASRPRRPESAELARGRRAAG